MSSIAVVSLHAKYLLSELKECSNWDMLGDFSFNYHQLMGLYNRKILRKDPEVSFGNVMTILREKGVISPLMRDPSIVYFVKGKSAEFLSQSAKMTSASQAITIKPHPRPIQIRKIKRVNGGMMLCQEDMPQTLPKQHSFCTTCGVPNSIIHEQTDRHEFSILYKYMLRQTKCQIDPPVKLSGKPFKLCIQSCAKREGPSMLSVNLLQRKGLQKIDLDVTCQCDKNNSVESSFNFVIGSAKLKKYKNALQFSNTQPKSTIGLEVDTSDLFCEEFIIVFKFHVSTLGSTERVKFYVMKKIAVRVDDDFTREDGEEISSKPSVQSEEPRRNDEKAHAFKVEEESDSLENAGKEINFRELGLRAFDIPQGYLLVFFSSKPKKGLNSGQESSVSPGIRETIARTIASTISTGLVSSNYSRFMDMLLYLEEHQVDTDLKSYTMRDVTLHRNKAGLYVLEVPGLAENRPSVLKYDKIRVALSADQALFGQVMVLQLSKIEISFAKNRKAPDDRVKKLDASEVTFILNRKCLRLQHRALELMQDTKLTASICFPEAHSQFTTNIPIKSWFNRLVGTNPEQCQAVQNIVNGTSKPAPYLLFGPPGTGKTVTIVESIKQVWNLHEDSHILATAPSNTAADLLAERILETLPPSQILRLYSPSRESSQVPQTLVRNCNFDGFECTIMSGLQLKKYRVIVCTLMCAGSLVTEGFPQGYFSHIFVDECGHALEPSALVPIAGLQGPPHAPSQIVLSGDPRQLGPVVRSPIAQQLGLGYSMLERLMDTMDIYKRDGNGKFNPKVLTKLVSNFRSHPDILKVPNELFYSGELKPEGEQLVTHSAVNWEYLPKQGFPLIFHGVSGKEDRDASSPSYFNISEVKEVLEYVEKVLDSKFCGQKLRPSDIGVLSPYRGQLSKIHKALERKGIKGVSIGSVEEFQGQERRVIIISTVRSNPLEMLIDQKFRIGFVKEPKRFNVAVTRAKALLIVIGNPHLLETDVNWASLLGHICSNGGYTGCQYVHDMSQHLPSFDEDLSCEASTSQIPLLELQEAGKETSEKSSVLDNLMKSLQQLQISSDDVSPIETYVSPPMMFNEL